MLANAGALAYRDGLGGAAGWDASDGLGRGVCDGNRQRIAASLRDHSHEPQLRSAASAVCGRRLGTALRNNAFRYLPLG